MKEVETEFLKDIRAFEFALGLKYILEYQAKIKGIKKDLLIHDNTDSSSKALISAGYVKALYSPVPVNYSLEIDDKLVYATPYGVRVGKASRVLKDTLNHQFKSLKEKLPEISKEEVPKVFSLIDNGVEPRKIYEYLDGYTPHDLEGRVFKLGKKADRLDETDFLGAVAFFTDEEKQYVKIVREILEAGHEKAVKTIFAGYIKFSTRDGDFFYTPFLGRPVEYFVLYRTAQNASNIQVMDGPIVILKEPLIKPEHFYGKQFKLTDGTKVYISKLGDQIETHQKGDTTNEVLISEISDSVQIANHLTYLVQKGFPIDFAISVNNEIVIKEPDDLFGNYNLGNLLLQDGRFKESVEYLGKAKETLSTFDASLVSYDNNIKESKEHIEAVILNNLGYANMMIGNNKEALDKLEQAIELTPRQPFTHNHMATVNQVMGNYARARELYTKELEINPNHPTAMKSVERIDKLVTLL